MTGGLAMIDRVDLLIAVIGIVVSVVGSSTAQWIALSKKADKDDLTRLEERMDATLGAFETRMNTRFEAVDVKFGAVDAKFEALESKIDGVDRKIDGVETRMGTTLTRVETKLDALILRLVPEQLPPTGELGGGRG
jgi:hypothetical protein